MPTIPKGLLDLLVYVIHSHSATCLGNHVQRFSRFSCQVKEDWVASITLRCWRQGQIGPRPKPKSTAPGIMGLGQAQHELKNYDEDQTIYLQDNLQKVWRKAANTDVSSGKLSFELDISSVVLSTNEFGDFSNCTIVSELLDDDSSGDKEKDDMGKLVEEARQLWLKFIHQPQAARCLVFFLILGKLCQKMHDEYDRATKTLAEILGLNSSFDRSEREWSQNENSPLEFELCVWCLESLHKLQQGLQASVDSLTTAREELLEQVQEVSLRLMTVSLESDHGPDGCRARGIEAWHSRGCARSMSLSSRARCSSSWR
jgi:hypothetical protein